MTIPVKDCSDKGWTSHTVEARSAEGVMNNSRSRFRNLRLRIATPGDPVWSFGPLSRSRAYRDLGVEGFIGLGVYGLDQELS